MGSYRREYESYYDGILKRHGKKKDTPRNSNLGGYSRSYNTGGRRKNKGSFSYIILTQTTGALALLLIMMCLKYAPYKEGNDVYAAFKEMSNEEKPILGMDLNIENIKDIDVVEVFNNLKNNFKDIVDDAAKKNKSFLNPVSSGEVKEIEDGVSIKTKEEKDVLATCDGKVKEVKNLDKGNLIIIDHEDGVESYYNLVNNPSIKIGDEVKKGTSIGKSSKVASDTYEMEFKIRYMGQFKEPSNYVDFKGE